LALTRRGGQGASEIEKYFRIRLRTGGTEEICFAGISINRTFFIITKQQRFVNKKRARNCPVFLYNILKL
jgi:hypothetical protein